MVVLSLAALMAVFKIRINSLKVQDRAVELRSACAWPRCCPRRFGLAS